MEILDIKGESGASCNKVSTLGHYIHNIVQQLDRLLFRIKIKGQMGSYPGDFRSWKSPQTLPALFIGPFEYVERFRNLIFAVK